MALAKPAGLDLLLESSRLALRAMQQSDQADLLALAGQEEIAQHTKGIPHPYHAAEAVKFLNHAEDKFRRGDAFAFAIMSRETGHFIGGADLAPLDAADNLDMELGYWIGIPHQGQGFATEAARRLLQFAVLDLGATNVIATVSQDNQASISVLEKLGMRLRRRTTEYWAARDQEFDVARYAIRAADVARLHPS